MRNQSHINFNKRRDLGSVISDTLRFVSDEFQPLVSVILKVNVIPMLMVIAAGIYYAYVTAKMEENNGFSEYGQPVLDWYDLGGSFLALLLLLIAFVVANTLIGVTTLSYIDSYRTNNGKVNFDDLSKMIKDKFPSYLGMSIITGIITGIGFIFCILPGFYFWATLALAPCILVFNDRGALDSFGDSFGFTKNYFWNTLGSIFVIWLIIFVISFIINIPLSLYTGEGIDFFNQNNTIEIDKMVTDPIYLLINVLIYLVGFFFEIITLVSRAFIYFDIREEENPTTPNIIDSIGTE